MSIISKFCMLDLSVKPDSISQRKGWSWCASLWMISSSVSVISFWYKMIFLIRATMYQQQSFSPPFRVARITSNRIYSMIKSNLQDLPLHSLILDSLPTLELGDNRFNLQDLNSPKAILMDADYTVLRKLYSGTDCYLVIAPETKKICMADLYPYSPGEQPKVRYLQEVLHPFLIKNFKAVSSPSLFNLKTVERGVIVVLYELGCSTLELDIQSKYFYECESTSVSDQRSCELIKRLATRLIQQLYQLLLAQTALLTIQPMTIIRNQQGYFLLPTLEAVVLKPEQKFVRSTAQLNKYRYSSPLQYQMEEQKETTCQHNMHLTDIYSLGIILIELKLRQKLTKSEVKIILEDRESKFTEVKGSFRLLFRESFYVINTQMFFLSDMMQMMLADREEDRSSALQLMLYLGKDNFLFDKLKIPFQEFFEKKVTKDGVNFKIEYSHLPINYYGFIEKLSVQALKDEPVQLIKDKLTLGPQGSIIYKGRKEFEGEFKDGRPSKGTIFINSKFVYTGDILNYSITGQGQFLRVDEVICKGRWHYGVMLDRPFDRKDFFKGIYAVLQQYNGTIKVFHRKQSNKVIINLSSLEDLEFNLHVISNFQVVEPIKILVKERQVNHLLNAQPVDLIFIEDDMISLNFYVGGGLAMPIFNNLLSNSKISWKSLSKADFSSSSINDALFKRFLSKRPNLKSLNIAKTQLTNESLRILFRSQSVNGLQDLNLSDSNISDDGIKGIIMSNIKSLKTLCMDNCSKISGHMLGRIFLDKKLWDLEKLSIEATQLNKQVLKQLPSLPIRLKSLNISKAAKFSRYSLEQLLRVFDLNNLQQLSMDNINMRSRMMDLVSGQDKAAVQKKKKIKIKMLSVKNSLYISAFFARSLTAQAFRGLSSLDLSNCPIDNKSLELLRISLSFIRVLILRSCFNLNNKSLQIICDWPQLQILDLAKTFIEAKTCQIFGERKLALVKFIAMDFTFDDLKYLEYTASSIRVIHLISSLLDSCFQISRLSNFDLEELVVWCSDEVASGIWNYNNSFRKLEIKEGKGFGSGWGKCEQVVGVGGIGDSCNKKQSRPEQSSLLELARSPMFQQVTSLNFSKEFEICQEELSKIFRSPFAKNLSSLDISWSSLGDSTIRFLTEGFAICDSDSFKLKNLCVAGQNHLSDPPFIDMIRNNVLTWLQKLDISWTQLTSEVLISMSKFGVKNIKELDLSKCFCINDKGLVSFLQRDCSYNLQVLNLKYTIITNITVQAISNSNFLHKLRYLSLQGCKNINVYGFSQLARSNSLPSLRILDLSWANLNSDFMLCLMSTSLQLSKLILQGLPVKQRFLIQLMGTPFFSSLECLDLTWIEFPSDIAIRLPKHRFGVVKMDRKELSREKTKQLLMKSGPNFHHR